MAAPRSRCGHYIFVLWFLLLFFSSPNLSRRRMDVYHTSTHDVALVRILDADLKHAARGSQKKCRMQKIAAALRRTTLSGYIFATKAHIDNQKKTY